MQALILAGGCGMRLRPLTYDIPVPLLFLPGGTLLDRLLHQLHDLDIDRIAVVLQHRGDRIARHLAPLPGVTTIPQMPPFTFVSALASAAPWVTEPTLVLHGNTLFPKGLRYFLEECTPGAPHVLLPTDGALHPREAKGYLLPPETFYRAVQAVEEDSLDALYRAFSEAGLPVIPVPARGRILPIRTAADYLEASRYLLSHWHEIGHPNGAQMAYDAMNFNWIAPDAEVDARSRLLFTAIGPGARVRDSQFHNALVLPHAHIIGEQRRDAIFSFDGSSLTRHLPMALGMAE